MSPFRNLCLPLMAALFHSAAWTAAAEEGFTPLFDGKSLAGWEGNEKVFSVEKGAIVAGSLEKKVEHNEFLCTTKEYGDFELRLKAKLVGKGDNAGVQFRSQRIPNHFEVIGYQCDMGNAAGKSIWGALYDESRRKKFLVTGDHDKLIKVLKPDDFNDLVIRCEGAHIQIWVNGEKTVDYKEEEKDIAMTGKIAVQIHGGEPAQASYKEIRIKELERSSGMPKRPFIYFDMGNVLLTFSHQLAAKQTAELCGIPEKLAWQILFDEGLHWEYERGELAEEQFLARFCQRARAENDFTAPDPRKFDLAASAIFELNTRILPILFGLRGAGYTLGVLSNTSSAHWRYCTSRFPFLLSLFHRHALSFQIGVMKPSASIYTKATEIAAVPPAEILFFDDRPENITAATAAGWDACLFTTPAAAARDLASRGIVTNY